MKTYAHTLKRFEEELADEAAKRSELQRRVEAKRRELLADRRLQLRDAALADPRARRQLEELEAAFRSYFEEDATPTFTETSSPARPPIRCSSWRGFASGNADERG